MNAHDAIEVLNELLAEESRTLLPRLRESIVFVSWGSADDQPDIAAIATETESFRAKLVSAINDLGGDPAPVWGDIRSTNVHFVEIDSVLPRILADEKRLLRVYEAGAAAIGDNDRAARVISEVIDSRRRHIDAIARLTELAQPKTN